MNQRGKLTPGDGKTIRAAENANTADDTPAFPGLVLNSSGGAQGPQPLFNPHAALLRFRMRFPNLQIIPVPNSSVTRVLAANVAEDMSLPDGTLAILFFSTAAFWANFNGAAVIPTVDSTASLDDALLIPQNFQYMLWVQGKKQLSIISSVIATVSAFCYIDLPMEGK